MKPLGILQHKTNNKLIFKQTNANVPPLGVPVSILKTSQQKVRIGKLIDIFGPVKQPWLVVQLNKKDQQFPSAIEFFWEKKSKYKQSSSKFKKNKNLNRNNNKDFQGKMKTTSFKRKKN